MKVVENSWDDPQELSEALNKALTYRDYDARGIEDEIRSLQRDVETLRNIVVKMLVTRPLAEINSLTDQDFKPYRIDEI